MWTESGVPLLYICPKLQDSMVRGNFNACWELSVRPYDASLATCDHATAGTSAVGCVRSLVRCLLRPELPSGPPQTKLEYQR
eukprot:2696269-Amphidinium_carterae.1